MWKAVPEDLSKKNERLKELNKKMIEAYPFLLPRNRWTDEVQPDYDYDYNEWEAIPLGWQIAFGWEFLNQLYGMLEQFNIIDQFRIEQIKEKFGELRFYCSGNEEVWNLVNDYTARSARTCIECGKPARYISKGWICPFCEEHIGQRIDDCWTVEEYFKNNDK